MPWDSLSVVRAKDDSSPFQKLQLGIPWGVLHGGGSVGTDTLLSK